jgi:hypothetical protein
MENCQNNCKREAQQIEIAKDAGKASIRALSMKDAIATGSRTDKPEVASPNMTMFISLSLSLCRCRNIRPVHLTLQIKNNQYNESLSSPTVAAFNKQPYQGRLTA